MDAQIIIVGGGVNGLWTLYDLAKQGIKVILFEQFPYPHTRGSSHGQSRITRYLYGQEEYAKMMPECFKMWQELQNECQDTILLKMGLLSLYNMFKNEDVVKFYEVFDLMDRYAPMVEVIPGDKIEGRFPGLKFDSKYKAIYDEEAALLMADKCLEVLRRKCIERGAIILESEPVMSINPVNDSKVEILTAKRRYYSQSVILTCGPFTNHLLSTCGLKLPLTTMKPYVFYWKDKSIDGVYGLEKGFPAVRALNYYSIPSHEYPGLIKICPDAILEVDPLTGQYLRNDGAELEENLLDEVRPQISKTFPNVDTVGPVVTENCVYTKTPDFMYILDHHPKHRNIIIGAGFSGMGFKTSPVVGKILGQLALGLEPSYPLDAFSIRRFCNSKL